MQIAESLFKRTPGPGDYVLYCSRMEKWIRPNNLLTVSKRVVLSHLTIGEERMFLAYRFGLVRQWVLDARRSDYFFGLGLRLVLKRLALQNLLNAEEQNFVSNFDNSLFTEQRSIKDLPVEFAKLPGETVGFHYTDCSLFERFGEQQGEMMAFCDVYLTSQRVYFASDLFIYAIDNADLRAVRTEAGGIVLQDEEGKVFFVACENPSVLRIAMNKMFRYRRIKL